MDELTDLPAPLPIDSLRRLARGLLYDRQRAEDVVQEAWLAALRKQPQTTNLTAWMRTAVRHLALDARRQERSRAAREHAAARPEAGPDPAEVLGQLEVLRSMLDAVEAQAAPSPGGPSRRARSALPEFWRAVDQVKNPVRADLVRVLILTGLRSLDARSIRWEDIAGLDTDEPTLHRPNPKGGPKKAFTLPVTRAVAEVLRRRRDENAVLFPGSPWVFPTADRGGRAVVHVKNAEEDSLHGFGYTPHRARDTYATACEEAGISVMATKLLQPPRPDDHRGLPARGQHGLPARGSRARRVVPPREGARGGGA